MTAHIADGAVVARLRGKSFPPADTGDTAKVRTQIASAVKEGIADDLVTEIGQAFASRYPAKVNNAAIDRLVSEAR